MFHSCTGDNGDSGVFDNTPLRNVDMKPFAVPIQQKLTKSDRKKVFTKSYPQSPENDIENPYFTLYCTYASNFPAKNISTI